MRSKLCPPHQSLLPLQGIKFPLSIEIPRSAINSLTAFFLNAIHFYR
ncbi:hypothetical protein D1AOALGA4SA_7963 [Olavius algarvensis Delta 1 endosymbiont]|nr:hypothetical protein D1AOALGA4SA_7963 [Olavius algarvensis Delta 1 endosymbiont]